MADNNNNRPKDEMAFSDGGRTRAKKSAPRAQRSTRYPLNLFDLLVIFVLLVAVVLLAFGIRLPDLFGGQEAGRACRLEYTVIFRGVDERFAQAVASGDALSTADTGVALGSVAGEVALTPHTVPTLVPSAEQGEEAIVVMKPVPGQVDITVTVVADAIYTQGVGYTVNGQALRAGAAYHVRFPNYVGVGSCDSLRELTAS